MAEQWLEPSHAYLLSFCPCSWCFSAFAIEEQTIKAKCPFIIAWQPQNCWMVWFKQKRSAVVYEPPLLALQQTVLWSRENRYSGNRKRKLQTVWISYEKLSVSVIDSPPHVAAGKRFVLTFFPPDAWKFCYTIVTELRDCLNTTKSFWCATLRIILMFPSNDNSYPQGVKRGNLMCALFQGEKTKHFSWVSRNT